MQVVGLLNTGVKSVDDTRAYTSLATVQKLLGESSTYITDISMRLKDREQADAIAMAFARQFGYKAESWREANKQYETGSKIRSIIGYAVSITLLVVAGFGIFNILSMSIQEKMKDIAILKAMGFSRRDVLGIFLIEAITIGVLGGTAGLILGFSFSYVISITTFTAGQMFDVNTYPVNFYASTYIAGFLFGLITTTLAGYFPSRKAGGLDPIAIIRA